MADEIRLQLSRRCADQVARILRETVFEARLSASARSATNAAEDMAEVLAAADAIERQLSTRTVVLKVLEVGPYQVDQEREVAADREA